MQPLAQPLAQLLLRLWGRNLLGMRGGPPSVNVLSRQFASWVGPTSLPYVQSTMHIDVDTPHQPRNTATIASCTYLMVQWDTLSSSYSIHRVIPPLRYRDQHTPVYHLPYAIYPVAMRSLRGRIAWTTKATCDFLYLVIACATHLLNGPMKWSERKKYSQTIGLMKRTRSA